VKLHFKLDWFSWYYCFKILESGPLPFILGLDFLSYNGKVTDLEARENYFRFVRDRRVTFEGPQGGTESARDSYFEHLLREK
jgi:hypothetical protein